MADVSDGGGLARHELNQADGLATVRESFERLRDLGVLTGASRAKPRAAGGFARS